MGKTRKLRNWLDRVMSSGFVPCGQSSDEPAVEALEQRLLMTAVTTLRVSSVVGDNRGQVVLGFNTSLLASSVTSKSVQILTSTSTGFKAVKTSIALASNRKTITATGKGIAPDHVYEVSLNAKLLKSAAGLALDGEFKGAAQPSGNGKAGGNYLARIQPASGDPVAHYVTSLGNIDVKLFSALTPLTVANFLSYANEGDWDGTFFHRSMPGFVIQAGGFDIINGQLNSIDQKPAVLNEPHVDTQPTNIRGTIAMAKLGSDPNSATNQWFFNLDDNRSNLDDQNGGFTAFGKITSKAGLKVMDAIAAKPIVNADPGAPQVTDGLFSNLPVIDITAINSRPGNAIDVKTDLIYVTRLAIRMDAVAPTVASAQPAAAALATMNSSATGAAMAVQLSPQSSGPISLAGRRDNDLLVADEDPRDLLEV